MLPASQTANPPDNRPTVQAMRWMIIGVVVVMVYTLLLGWGIVFKIVPYEYAYLWMALPCLAPIALYSYGFLKVGDSQQDFGLLLSAVGWILVTLALVIKHAAVMGMMRDAASGGAAMTNANPPATTICLVLAIICLVLGGIVSWQAWVRGVRRGP